LSTPSGKDETLAPSGVTARRRAEAPRTETAGSFVILATSLTIFYQFIKIFLREGMVFVNVGANIDPRAINAAWLVASTRSLFAYEADPETYRLLLENIERLNVSNVQVRQTYVADEVGAVSFSRIKRAPSRRPG